MDTLPANSNRYPIVPTPWAIQTVPIIVRSFKTVARDLKLLSVNHLSLIGSYGRFTARENSDLDFLIVWLSLRDYQENYGNVYNLVKEMFHRPFSLATPERLLMIYGSPGWEWPRIKLFPVT